MGDELFDPWFNESDIDAMRHGYDVPRNCFRAGWDLAQERIAEIETENQRLRDALQKIADGEANLGWQPCSYIAKQALEKVT